MPDYVLFEKIFEHQRTQLSRGLSERQEANLASLLNAAKERYPKWDPESGVPPYLGDYRVDVGREQEEVEAMVQAPHAVPKGTNSGGAATPGNPSFDKRRY